MSKTKVDLTLGEIKTKVDLTLEQKNSSLKWADWKWSTANSPWSNPKISASLESKTKVDLTLE